MLALPAYLHALLLPMALSGHAVSTESPRLCETCGHRDCKEHLDPALEGTQGDAEALKTAAEGVKRLLSGLYGRQVHRLKLSSELEHACPTGTHPLFTT